MERQEALDKCLVSRQKQRPAGASPGPTGRPETNVANHKQAAKRNRQRIKRRQRNLLHLTTMRTYIKRVRKHLESNEIDEAQKALPVALRSIDRAVSKGVVHQNTGSRYISRLTVAVAKAG